MSDPAAHAPSSISILLRRHVCGVRSGRGRLGVIKRHGDRLVGAAEVPHIPDGIAAAPSASP
jgi:hypothetical protein